MCLYTGWGNDAGRMLAAHMTELAFKLAMTDSTTPEEYEARKDQLDEAAREQWEAVGYERGRADGSWSAAGSAYGHMA